MQHFRKVTSLQEDFQMLGLLKPRTEADEPVVKKPEDEEGADAEVKKEGDEPVLPPTEGEEGEKKDGEEDEEQTEAKLIRQRTKRMSGSKKAKARLSARKHKAKRKRTTKLKKRLTKFKNRIKKFIRLKGKKKAGPRTRFKLAAGMDHRMANMLESLDTMSLVMKGSVQEDLSGAFKNVILLSSTLARKYAVMEEIMLKLEDALPVEHPDSASGYDLDKKNVKVDGKTGDAMDTTMDTPATEEEEPIVDMTKEEEGDGGEGWDWEDDSEEEGDDGETMGDDDMDGDMDDDGEDEEDEEDAEVEESRGLEHDLMQLRLEAEDVLDKMKTSVLSPDVAADVLKDMVAYLGGALKSYMDLAASIAPYAYAGQGAPAPVGQGVVPAEGGNKYAGQDAPNAETKQPDPQTK